MILSPTKPDPRLSKSILSVLSVAEADDVIHWSKKLMVLPEPLQMRFAKRFAWHYDQKIERDGKSVKVTANTYLRKKLARLTPRIKHIQAFMQNQPHDWHDLNNVKRTEKLAEKLAMLLADELVTFAGKLEHDCMVSNIKECYQFLALRCRSYAITPPFDGVEFESDELLIASYEVAILKMCGDKWWKRRMKRHRLHSLEWLEIAMGEVSKTSGNSYASKQCVNEYKARQKSCADWIEMMELTGLCFDEQTNSFFENTISLADAVKSGMANPENRRNELMLRMRHMEEYADEINYIGIFYTITAPSAYHANADHWNGSSPHQTNKYFTTLWGKIRSKLKRLELDYFGIRVSEPHADGTPHWHMALFMSEKDHQAVTAIMRKYAITEDTEELYARYGQAFGKPVVKVKTQVQPTSKPYLFKASVVETSKCVRGGEKKLENFKAYKKARRTWGLRKSQGEKLKAPQKFSRIFSPRFTAVKIDKAHGSATSYIAKYISKNIDGFKVSDHIDEETDLPIEQSINPVAAWASNWNIRQFQFQGSPSITVYRELRKVNSPLHDPEMTEVRYAADRGDFKAFIKAMGGMNQGRKAKFKTLYEEIPEATEYNETARKVKGVVSENQTFAALSRVTAWGLSKVSAANPSWTCGINCTDSDSRGSSDSTQLRKLGFRVDEINLLNRGCRVNTGDGFTYQVKDNQLREYRH
jgi:hypothetical protein